MAETVKVAVIGAGPAGIAAAIYLQRAGLSPLVLEKEEPGGLLRNANLVENYPGFSGGIGGEELAARFSDQLSGLGVTVLKETVRCVKSDGRDFRISTDAGEHAARAVIVATGTRAKRPSIGGIGELLGERAFLDIVSIRGRSVKGKRAVVIGGGDAAFDYALNLRRRGAHVAIISRSEPRCLPLLRERANRRNIRVVAGVQPVSVTASDSEVIVRCRRNEKTSEMRGDLVLIATGRAPELSILDRALLRRVRVSERYPSTSVRGLFLAGDVIRGGNRQTGIAVGDGILAGMLAEQFVNGRRDE